MFVAHIHNNSLGRCFPVDSFEEGVEKIKEIIAEREDLNPSDEQLEDLENTYEISFTDDPENITTFSIGLFDK